MGNVFLAEHVLLGRQAAVKTLHPELTKQPEIVERFFNEARATSTISDGGVVQIFDFGYHDDTTAYIVMELLEGETLAERMDRVGELPMVEALRIARQCAAALAAAHAKDIVHRDLKPENIFLVHDSEAQAGERAKVLDFGICKSHSPHLTVRTLTGVTMGTPIYMSPEQCRGAADVDHRSDLYSLGCVLFHMLTGQPPFDGEGTGDLIAAHVRDTAPAPSTIRPAIPPGVDAIIARCLAKEPDARYESIDELRIVLEQAQARLSSPGDVSSAIPRPAQIATPRPETPVVRLVPTRPAMPTTMGASVGQIDLRPRSGRWVGRIGALAVAGVIALVVGTVVMNRSADSGATEPAAAAEPGAVAEPVVTTTPPRAVAPVVAEPTPSLAVVPATEPVAARAPALEPTPTSRPARSRPGRPHPAAQRHPVAAAVSRLPPATPASPASPASPEELYEGR